MPKKRRLSPNALAKLKDDFAGLRGITDYRSSKADFEVPAIQAVDTAYDSLLDEEAQTEAHLADIRNQIADKGTEYTLKMKGSRQQVVAQYGDDSPEYETVGGTRTSNRRTGGRRSSSNNAPTG